jgi:hypothetical protein
MELEKDASHGAEAEAILNSPIFKSSLETVQQAIFDDFAKVDPKDTEELVILRLKLRCLADVMRDLTAVMRTGQLARAQLEQQKTITERVTDKARQMVRAVF